MTYENIPYDASIKFPNDPMQRILPFNFSKSIEFSPEYLSGNLAEMSDAIPNTFELKAKYQIDLDSEKLLKNELKNQYPNLRIINYKKNTKLLDKNHVLLPIIYYSNGDDLIVMNGQTGNFYTNFPRVKEKK